MLRLPHGVHGDEHVDRVEGARLQVVRHPLAEEQRHQCERRHHEDRPRQQPQQQQRAHADLNEGQHGKKQVQKRTG